MPQEQGHPASYATLRSQRGPTGPMGSKSLQVDAISNQGQASRRKVVERAGIGEGSCSIGDQLPGAMRDVTIQASLESIAPLPPPPVPPARRRVQPGPVHAATEASHVGARESLKGEQHIHFGVAQDLTASPEELASAREAMVGWPGAAPYAHLVSA